MTPVELLRAMTPRQRAWLAVQAIALAGGTWAVLVLFLAAATPR